MAIERRPHNFCWRILNSGSGWGDFLLKFLGNARDFFVGERTDRSNKFDKLDKFNKDNKVII